jgi:RNA polymerase primary sigma factor
MSIQDKSEFSKYYDIFKKIPLLGPKEERELMIKVKTGDQEARKTFVSSNIRLVMFRVLKYCAHDDPRAMDLVSEGTLGLMRAIELFDVSKNFRFSTYAVWWINCYIRRSIRFFKREKPLILASLHQQFRQADHELKMNGIIPSEEQIAAYLGWDQYALKLYQKYREAPEFNAYIAGDVADDIPDAMVETINRKDVQILLDSKFKRISSIEEDIIRRYYGIGHEHQTYDQIGEFYRMTKEWVRQAETKALRKLFILLNENKISEDVVDKSRNKGVTKKLMKTLSKLSSVEEDIIRRMYGLGYMKHTSDQVAKFYGMPKSWVMDREKEALAKMEDLLKTKIPGLGETGDAANPG